MLIWLIQSVLAAGASYGLWRLWRRWFGGGDARAILIVGIGFLLRAVIAQALFWISYLRLPIARSLQLGDGIFFFVDGWWYIGYARHLVTEGPMAVLRLADARYPSQAFVQVLSAFVALFGGAVSVAILLNCAAYLATCAILLRLQPRVNGAVLFALAAVAFGPGALLWSLQPLKDTFFLLLIALLVLVCKRWQEQPRLWLAVAIVALVYALASVRWYFGLAVLGGLVIFFVITALRTRRRVWVLAGSVATLVIIAQAVRLGGGQDMPNGVGDFLDPRPRIAALWRPSNVTHTMTKVRSGFEQHTGGTAIVAGPRLAPKQAVAQQPTPTASAAPPPPITPAPAPRPKPVKPKPGPLPPAPTFMARMVTGTAAAFLPRIVGEALGLVRVGGGRGLWIFAELDTIALDVVLLFAIVYIARTRPRITPLFVLVLLVFVVNAIPMVYTVTNFGTLFRLRTMLYFLLAVLPLTLGPSTRSSES